MRKFEQLDQFEKLKVWLFYEINFIKLEVVDGYTYNHLSFEEFKTHKYGGQDFGEQDRIMDLFYYKIFS